MSLARIPIEVEILAAYLGLQLAVPLLLIAALALARPAGTVGWLAATAVVGAYLIALAVIGQFGAPLPWYAPAIHALFAAAAAARAWRRRRPAPRRTRGRAWVGLRGIVACALAVTATVALRGYDPPSAPGVDLRFPLDDGHYYIAAAGNSLLINHHLVTLNDAFRRNYRGQSYGVDITRLNSLGVTAFGIMPRDPAAYAIFGTPVKAPCNGRVSRRHDGAPDMPVPQRDLGRPLGNHVFIDCRDATVVLAHLQRGSVAVEAGQQVTSGRIVGRVGNSGQTTAPHLHIHAQRGGERYRPLRATPVVMRFSGRYPVRNSHFRR